VPLLATTSYEIQCSLNCYPGFVDHKAQPSETSLAQGTLSPTFEELAARQGVSAITNFESLLGKPLPEDESAEEFSTWLREQRREDTRPVAPQ
jgi:hypothetical protein